MSPPPSPIIPVSPVPMQLPFEIVPPVTTPAPPHPPIPLPSERPLIMLVSMPVVSLHVENLPENRFSVMVLLEQQLLRLVSDVPADEEVSVEVDHGLDAVLFGGEGVVFGLGLHSLLLSVVSSSGEDRGGEEGGCDQEEGYRDQYSGWLSPAPRFLTLRMFFGIFHFFLFFCIILCLKQPEIAFAYLLVLIQLFGLRIKLIAYSLPEKVI